MFRRFQSLVDPFQAYDDAAPPRDAHRYLFSHLRPFRAVIATSLALTLVSAGIEVWLIFYAGRLVDLLAAAQPALFWADYGGELVAVLLLVLIGRPLAGIVRETLNDVAFRPNAETMIRWRAHGHVLQHSVGWFRNDLAGRLASMVREAGTAATGAAYAVIHTLAYVGVYVIGSIAILGAIDIRLLWPLLVWLALYFGLIAYVVPRYRRASEGLQEANSVLTGMLVDSYANIDTIKLFAEPEAERREGRAIFGATLRSFFAVQRLEVTMNGGMLFLSSLLLVGLIGYGVVLWQAGAAPVGLVAAALALSFRITAMGEWLLDAVSSLFGHLGALRQALKSVAQPLDLVDAAGAKALVLGGGAIGFDMVSHHYGKGDGGLDRVSLSIAAGEKVGLVGRSGAGKSTLVNLLLRFFDPETGSIAIDGQDIAGVTQESLRRHIGMVTQDATLLYRSVRDNIAYGRSGITDVAVDAALRRAAADGFVAGLRDGAGRTGLDAHVGERGVKLSGGQRQRIALARVLLKDAPILILDEATSALDSEVEAEILATLYGVMEGKTVIAIAHRLSTIARMDRIVVLDRGRIAEQGPHAQLLGRLHRHRSGRLEQRAACATFRTGFVSCRPYDYVGPKIYPQSLRGTSLLRLTHRNRRHRSDRFDHPAGGQMREKISRRCRNRGGPFVKESGGRHDNNAAIATKSLKPDMCRFVLASQTDWAYIACSRK